MQKRRDLTKGVVVEVIRDDEGFIVMLRILALDGYIYKVRPMGAPSYYPLMFDLDKEPAPEFLAKTRSEGAKKK